MARGTSYNLLPLSTPGTPATLSHTVGSPFALDPLVVTAAPLVIPPERGREEQLLPPVVPGKLLLGRGTQHTLPITTGTSQ